MFEKLLLALGLAAGLFIGYLLLRAYKPGWFRSKSPEGFKANGAKGGDGGSVASPLQKSGTNQALPAVPAPAPPIKEDPPQEPRTISPGGPNPPNVVASPEVPPTLSPDAKPSDPYDDLNMEAPIHDSMRHPERSFGPGIENTDTRRMRAAGTGSSMTHPSETPFSPEFAQNGGGFMGEVFANDIQPGDRFAEA